MKVTPLKVRNDDGCRSQDLCERRFSGSSEASGCSSYPLHNTLLRPSMAHAGPTGSWCAGFGAKEKESDREKGGRVSIMGVLMGVGDGPATPRRNAELGGHPGATSSHPMRGTIRMSAVVDGSSWHPGQERKTSSCSAGGLPPPPKSAPRPTRMMKLARLARKLVDHTYFIIGTTVLTIYALVGDDFKLMLTNKPADAAFDVITGLAFAVFSIELVFSCIGKDDYWMSFFFWLDAVSTITLILDVSSVNESLLSVSSGGGTEQLRSGRTARLGARAGRVVRVIRLVRILKLYKAVYEAKQKASLQGEDGDDWLGNDDDDQEQAPVGLQESRVGKKLSELTTRKVIILVLTMLIVLPFLRTETGKEVPPSATYGADDVWETYSEWRNDTSSEQAQWRYENALMKYIYYHNWFNPQSEFYSHVFWLGIAGQQPELLAAQADHTRLHEPAVAFWEQKATKHDSVLGSLPPEVQDFLLQNWDSQCSEQGKGLHQRGFSLLQREVEDEVSYAVPCPTDLRYGELRTYTPLLMTKEESEAWHFIFYFDARPFTRSEARYGVIITGFICFVLVVASIFFSRDANNLVLNPLEKMVRRVVEIRHDPLVAMKMADEEFKAEERQKDRAASRGPKQPYLQKLRACCGAFSEGTAREPMETVVLEKTIIKLGSLLALGFGEAGANIIGQNMASSDTAGVNAMVSGFKVECILGKARIRNFSTATEVLQGKVMTFVNQIAEIVHGVVDEFHGAANKNNGDFFLLIWRLPEESDLVARMADMSMIAFARIYGAVHSSYVLAAYRGHPALQQRLGTDCRVDLSFGLHAGWAIEGAVGSEYKIDASYISPNVSIASNVEAATTSYAVPFLMSEAVIKLMSVSLTKQCRHIDHVMIKGSLTPLRIYALDLDGNNLAIQEPIWPPPTWNSRQRFRARQFLEAEKNKKLDQSVQVIRLFDLSGEIRAMRRQYTVDFLQLWEMGYENYSQGEWQVARRMLSATRTMLLGHAEDGPSSALLRFMESFAYQAPDKWEGVRELVCGSTTD